MTSLSASTEKGVLVAFFDLAGFARYARGRAGHEVFDTMSAWFERAGDLVGAGGGKILKCMGDAALAVFPEESVAAGVEALLAVKEDGEKWFAARGVSVRVTVKCHFGPVTCGPVGPKGDKRPDVYGETVNTAAVLKSNGSAMTPAVFRKLPESARKRFKKHTPPVTYIPVEESHAG